MKKILIAIIAVVCLGSLCYAAQGADKPKATEPVGAVIETTGVFMGKISDVIEEAVTDGKKKGTLTVADGSGKTKAFPVDETVKIVDASFHALTLDQLNKGEKVLINFSKGKVTQVKVEK